MVEAKKTISSIFGMIPQRCCNGSIIREKGATFVWIRVQEIQTLNDSQIWRHVPGYTNPANREAAQLSGYLNLNDG